jgi:hypothetical protein
VRKKGARAGLEAVKGDIIEEPGLALHEGVLDCDEERPAYQCPLVKLFSGQFLASRHTSLNDARQFGRSHDHRPVRRPVSPPLLDHGALNSFRLAHLLSEINDRGDDGERRDGWLT